MMDRSAVKINNPAWKYMKSVGISLTQSRPIGAPYKVNSSFNHKVDCVNTVNMKRWFDAIIFQLAGRSSEAQFPLGRSLKKIIGDWDVPQQTMSFSERYWRFSPDRFNKRNEIKLRKLRRRKTKKSISL